MREPILVINAGSSSIKFSVFETMAGRNLSAGAHGQVEGIGSSPHLEVTNPKGKAWARKFTVAHDCGLIICGSGSSPGSVVAGQLAENPQVSVLLIDAGSEDNVPSVNEPGQWFLNLGPNGTGAFGRGRLLRHGRTDPLETLGAEKQKHVLCGSLRLLDDLFVRRLRRCFSRTTTASPKASAQPT
jgi:hypothetical protein